MNQRVGLLSIGELERLSGTPRHAIHRYIRSGLLPKPLKTSKTMAYYNEAHLERLEIGIGACPAPAAVT